MDDRPLDALHFKGRVLFLSDDPDIVTLSLRVEF